MIFCPLSLRRMRAPCLLALVLAACLGLPERSQAQAARPADYIVAVVNSEPITNSEVRARLARIEQQLARERTAAPPRAELIRQVLERLIIERAQAQAARQAGIKVDEAAIDEAERNVVARTGSRRQSFGVDWPRTASLRRCSAMTCVTRSCCLGCASGRWRAEFV